MRSFEVDTALLADDNNVWDGVMQHTHDMTVGTIEDAEGEITKLGEDAEALDAPWHVNCPI